MELVNNSIHHSVSNIRLKIQLAVNYLIFKCFLSKSLIECTHINPKLQFKYSAKLLSFQLSLSAAMCMSDKIDSFQSFAWFMRLRLNWSGKLLLKLSIVTIDARSVHWTLSVSVRAWKWLDYCFIDVATE